MAARKGPIYGFWLGYVGFIECINSRTVRIQSHCSLKLKEAYTSIPVMVPVLDANLSVSRPSRWSMETNKFGSG